MSNIDILLMSLTNLWRRKLRTVLTILGVLIGTTSVVVMLSLGNGMKAANEKFVESMGDMTIIEVYQGGGGDKSDVKKKTWKLNKEGIEAIKKLPGVVAVMPRVQIKYPVSLKSGKYMVDYVNVLGIDTEIFDEFGFKLEDGRKLNKGEKNAVIYGAEIHGNFINPKSRRWEPMDVDVKTAKVKLVIGDNEISSRADGANSSKKIDMKLNYAGTLKSGGRNDYSIFMTMEYIDYLNSEYARINNIKVDKKNTEYNQLQVKCADFEAVKTVNESLKEMGFETFAMVEILEDIDAQTGVIQMVLGGIGGVSLIVAAIGITNTMIMSIYERTKEIGVMKVIGASLGDINKLFLIEAGLIGFFGGLIGLILSIVASNVINTVTAGAFDEGSLSIIPFELMIQSLVFSTLIGLVSGYLPARRAMNLSALEAIRTE